MSHVIGRVPVLTVNSKGIVTDAAEADLYAGDVDGPGPVTPGNLAVFADASGQQLADGGAPGAINWMGPWVAGSPGYDTDDLVEHGGSSWIATAPTTDEPGVGSPNAWDLVAAKGSDGLGTWMGPWMAGAYAADDIVEHEGSTWIALAPTSEEPGHPTASPAQWDLVAQRGVGIWRGPWAGPSPAYAAGDIVQYLGSSYISTADGNGDVPGTSPSAWDLLAAKGDSGGGGGSVDSVTADGNGVVTVDNADPTNPVIAYAGWKTIWKVTTEDRFNNTVAADSVLTLALAVKKYSIRIKVFYTAHATPDIRFKLSFSGTVNDVSIERKNCIPGATTLTIQLTEAFDAGNTAITATTGQDGMVEYDIRVDVATSGTMAFEWAQTTTDAVNAARVYSGSYIDYRQLN